MNIMKVIEEDLKEGWSWETLMDMYHTWAKNKYSSFSEHCGFFCMEILVCDDPYESGGK